MNHTREVIKLFLKLGFIAFGGPAVHIAMMQDEVVRKRQWMNEQHFLDLIGATNLIPGPNSTEMAIHIGYEKAGWRGLIAGGVCFILPAVLITGLIAWLYKQYGQLPQVQPFVYGIKPAIIAVILAAIFPLAKKSLKTVTLAFIGFVALALGLAGFNEIYIMFGAGFFCLLLSLFGSNKIDSVYNVFPFALSQIASSSISSITNLNLFLTFLKIGTILYGSGYVLFAFLDAELVSKGILSRQQLIDAIAVGQFTPGPVFSSVTFIGYQINGIRGAVVSTIAIFLPSFIFIAVLNPLIPKLRNSKSFSVFLDGVNVASVAIIIVVCYEMGRESINDWRTMFIAAISISIAFGFRKVNSTLVILFGSLGGYLLLKI